MKSYAIILSLLISLAATAQNTDSTQAGFGFALSTNYNTEIMVPDVAPTFLYYAGNHQLELTPAISPFSLKQQRVASGTLNYKYFPNGRNQKFNLYMLLSMSYANQLKKTYYPTTNQYLMLSGGYGFQIKVTEKSYLGTNVQLGTFSRSVQSENPYIAQLGVETMFENFGMQLSCQVSFGFSFK